MIKIILSALFLVSLPAMNALAQAPVSSQEAGSTEQRLQRIERMLDNQGLLDMLQQLQQLQREISMLRGEIETQNYNLGQLTRRQRDLYTDIDQRLQRLERGAGASTDTLLDLADTDSGDSPPLETLTPIGSYNDTPSGVTTGSPLQIEIVGSATENQQVPDMVEESTATGDQTGPDTDMNSDTGISANNEPVETMVSPRSDTPADPVQLQAEYQQAFNLLRQSLYDQAIRAFQQYLSAHPDDLYSDNAQYWLAEAHYVKREFESALGEYKKVVANFPQSQKANDALLKIGFTLHELGEFNAAREQLQELIQRQPGSTVARLADERLKRIGSIEQQVAPTPLDP